jgi:hypothetical protein
MQRDIIETDGGEGAQTREKLPKHRLGDYLFTLREGEG